MDYVVKLHDGESVDVTAERVVEEEVNGNSRVKFFNGDEIVAAFNSYMQFYGKPSQAEPHPSDD